MYKHKVKVSRLYNVRTQVLCDYFKTQYTSNCLVVWNIFHHDHGRSDTVNLWRGLGAGWNS